MLQIFEAPYKRMTKKEVYSTFPNKLVLMIDCEDIINDSGAVAGLIGYVVAVADKEDRSSLVDYSYKFAGETTLYTADTYPRVGRYLGFRVKDDEET